MVAQFEFFWIVRPFYIEWSHQSYLWLMGTFKLWTPFSATPWQNRHIFARKHVAFLRKLEYKHEQFWSFSVAILTGTGIWKWFRHINPQVFCLEPYSCATYCSLNQGKRLSNSLSTPLVFAKMAGKESMVCRNWIWCIECRALLSLEHKLWITFRLRVP